jgi:hypothetical protein
VSWPSDAVTPFKPRELRAWVRYYATKGAWCPHCAVKFTENLFWIWTLPGRIYLICRTCASVGKKDLIQPEGAQAFLESHQWVNGSGCLEYAKPRRVMH